MLCSESELVSQRGSLSKLRIAAQIWLALLASIPASSQFTQRSSIGGTVTDPTGAVVPGAAVTLTDLDQHKTATAQTNSDGQYSFAQLNTGSYQVSVNVPGFEKSVSSPIHLTTQQNARLDIKLQTGSVQQTVEVTSAQPLLETDRAELDQNIDMQQIQSLPINGRNYTALAALVPGISTYPQANVNTGGTYAVGANYAFGGEQYNVGGQFENTPADNGYYINGINATENYVGYISYAPSPDAIQDVRIAVDDFSAASGHDISTFEVSTRAGTNRFHGQAYDYLENDALNSINSYQEQIGIFTKGEVRRNQFGGGLGGPVIIPHVWEKLKDRAFFFVNYEEQIDRDGLPATTGLVPTQAEKSGNFSDLCSGGFGSNGNCLGGTPIYDPTTGSPFPGNIIPPNRISSQATTLANLWPNPNAYSATNLSNGYDYLANAFHADSVYHFDSRYDYRISDFNNLYVTVSKQRGSDNNTGGIFPDYNNNNQDQSWLVSANDAHIFTPTLTNEFIFGIGRGGLTTATPAEFSLLNGSSNPLNSIFSNTGTGINRGIFQVYVSGYASPGLPEVFQAANSIVQTSDNLSWVHGINNFTFGMNWFFKGETDWDFNRYVSFGCVYNYIAGECPATYMTGSNGVGGNGFADLLLGMPETIHQRYEISGGDQYAPELDVRFPYWGFYANDRVQVNRKLSVSLGLRYDLIIPIYAPNDLCCALVNESVPNWELQIPGLASGVPQHFLSAKKTNFAPRLSVAYSITSKLVFRAGYGIFYDEGGGQISGNVGNALNGVPGYFAGENLASAPGCVSGSASNPCLNINQIFPQAPTVAPGTYPISYGKGTGILGTDYPTVYTFSNQSNIVPRYQRYQTGLQYEVTPTSVAQILYDGDMGRNGLWFQGSNLPPLSNPSAPPPNNSGNFGTIYYLNPGLSTNYNGLILRYQKRMSHGFSIDTNYTFSKVLANRYTTTDANQNWIYNLNGSYGVADNNHPQRFVFTAVWNPEYGKAWNAIARQFLTGWQISSITTLESGGGLTPINASGTSSGSLNGPALMGIVAGGDPNLGHFTRTFQEQFNTAAFFAPPNGVTGNAMPGLIIGPGYINSDISAAKTFNLSERFKLDFRTDFLNAFNHPQWTSVSIVYPVDIYDGNIPFGQVEGSRDPRILQVSAKIHF